MKQLHKILLEIMISLIFANGTDICIYSHHSEVRSSQPYRLHKYGAQ